MNESQTATAVLDPAEQQAGADAEVFDLDAADSLVEEVSIDGMCGVY